MNLTERNEKIISMCVARMNQASNVICATLARENLRNVTDKMQAEIANHKAALARASEMQRKGEAGSDQLVGNALLNVHNAESALAQWTERTDPVKMLDDRHLAQWFRDVNAESLNAVGQHDGDPAMDLLKRSGQACRIMCNLIAEGA